MHVATALPVHYNIVNYPYTPPSNQVSTPPPITSNPNRPLTPAVPPSEMFKSLLTQLFNALEARINQLFLSKSQGNTALAIAGQAPNFSTLNTLVGAAELGTALTTAEAKGPLTILAPTNQAFAALPADIRQKLTKPENKAALQQILQYHVSAEPFKFNSSGAGFNSLLPDAQDKNRIFGTAFNSTLLNNGTEVSTAGPSIAAANGSVIIPINQVLIPPGLDVTKLV